MVSPWSMRQAGFRAASRLGVGKEAVVYLDRATGTGRYGYLDGVDDRIGEYDATDRPSRGAVLFSLIPAYPGVAYRACILAHAFRTRGYDPVVLRCERGRGCGLERCLYPTSDTDDPTTCALCRANGSLTTEAFGLDSPTLGDVFPTPYPVSDDVDVDSAVAYREIPVGRFALASTRKFLQQYHVDTGDPNDRAVFSSFLDSAVHLVDVYERLFEERSFDAVLVNESVYVHGGVPLSVAEQYDVPGYSVDVGFQDETMSFGSNANRSTEPHFTDDDTVEAFLSTSLTADQKRAVDAVLDDRRSGAGAFLFSSMEDVSVETTGDGPVVGMFTNLVWDASLQFDSEEVAFDDVFEWVGTTVDAFVENDDATLVVKTHPAEHDLGTNEGVGTWIHDHYDPLPENVVVLPPDTDVNTYRLIEDVDVGLTFTTTVGLEMACEGLPVVVAGDSFYRGYGFTYDPSTVEAYREYLGSLDTLTLDGEGTTRARRFAYFAFLHQCFSFPYISVNLKTQEFEYHAVSHDDVAPGADQYDRIVERVTSGRPIVPEDRR